ncbi:hypothetical protein C3L29_034980 [Pseudomonas sp. MWU12-2534b]|nr:hypothetical protein C3L29_034980 [Pseudomonas sp. MWU12-2534b]
MIATGLRGLQRFRVRLRWRASAFRVGATVEILVGCEAAIVNDDAGCLNARVARTFIASRLAPTVA